jgi:FixJ family two-component response regulator
MDANARLIVLTTFGGDEDIYRGLRAGEKSYLLVGVRREDIFQAIRKVYAGRTFQPPAIAAKRAGRLPGADVSLREMGVLSQLIQGKSNKITAAELLISEVTVKSHVQSFVQETERLEPHRSRNSGEPRRAASNEKLIFRRNARSGERGRSQFSEPRPNFASYFSRKPFSAHRPIPRPSSGDKIISLGCFEALQ